MPYLCAMFKAETGQSPAHYYKSLRIAKARELLESDEAATLSVKEVAVRVGVHDLSHFARDFEQQFGVSPKHYRARHFGWEDGFGVMT